jgi:hypothetical protein
MIRESIGPWTAYRERFGFSPDDEIDLHFDLRDPHKRYREVMQEVEELVRDSLHKAQANDRPYIMYIHGGSTSRRGAMTARSVVRGFMRSKEATPFIERSKCVQHETVFVAKIKPLAT